MSGEERPRDAGTPQQRLPRQRMWPHRGLVDSVPKSEITTGTPEPVPYVWHAADTEREHEVAAYLAALRARLCPGVECRRLEKQECLKVCARPAPDGDLRGTQPLRLER